MELSVSILSGIKKILSTNNYSLYDAYLEMENQNLFLRIYIQNSTNSISLEDCIKSNELLTSYFDENDPVEDKYILEISSPGVVKYLRTTELMKDEIDSKVCVHLKKADNISKQKIIIGILKTVTPIFVTIDDLKINHSDIKKIETYYEF